MWEDKKGELQREFIMNIKGWKRFYNVVNTMRIFETKLSLMILCNKIMCESKKGTKVPVTLWSCLKVVGEMAGK